MQDALRPEARAVVEAEVIRVASLAPVSHHLDRIGGGQEE